MERGRKGARRRAQPGFKSRGGAGLASTASPMAPAAASLALLALVASVAPALGVAVPSCDYPVHLWCSSPEIAVACQVRATRARAARARQGHPAHGDMSRAGLGCAGTVSGHGPAAVPAASAGFGHRRGTGWHSAGLRRAPAWCWHHGTPQHSQGSTVPQPDADPDPSPSAAGTSAFSA